MREREKEKNGLYRNRPQLLKKEKKNEMQTRKNVF